MKKIVPYAALLIISLFATRSFFTQGFIPTHDGEYHIVRQWQFSKAFSEGHILPIWAPDLNNGYGVPLFEFFYPLPAYIAHIFVFFGASFITSIKLVIGSGMVVSSITFYLWAKRFFKALPALVGSTAYLLAPYHTVDASIRGSVGEVWALALAPLALFLLTKLLDTKKYGLYLVLFSITAMFLIISHNIVGLLFYAFVFVYGLFYCFLNKRLYSRIFVGFLYSLALSAFFWLPIIFESWLVSGLNINNYYEHFPTMLQLVLPSWGTGFSIAGQGDQMSFQIGLVHIIGVILASVYAVKRKNFLIIFIALTFVISVLFMLERSNILWKIISPLQVMQFPWRLLSISILTSSFLLGYVSNQYNKIAWIALTLCLALYFSYTMPVIYLPREDKRYIENPEWIRGTTTWGNTFTVNGFIPPENISQDDFKIVDGVGKIISSTRLSHKSEGQIETETNAIVEVKRAYFPGWQVLVNKKQQEIVPINGIIRFTLPPGNHKVLVILGLSIVRLQAVAISLLTFISLFLYLLPVKDTSLKS